MLAHRRFVLALVAATLLVGCSSGADVGPLSSVEDIDFPDGPDAAAGPDDDDATAEDDVPTASESVEDESVWSDGRTYAGYQDFVTEDGWEVRAIWDLEVRLSKDISTAPPGEADVLADVSGVLTLENRTPEGRSPEVRWSNTINLSLAWPDVLFTDESGVLIFSSGAGGILREPYSGQFSDQRSVRGSEEAVDELVNSSPEEAPIGISLNLDDIWVDGEFLQRVEILSSR